MKLNLRVVLVACTVLSSRLFTQLGLLFLVVSTVSASQLDSDIKAESATKVKSAAQSDLSQRQFPHHQLPYIVTSIRPLGLLAQELVGERGRVETLLEGSVSAHHYALSVAERRKLISADIVLWVGAELETFLQKPISQRVAQEKSITITSSDLKGIRWPESSGDSHHGHDHSHDHGENSRDPHLWLNPLNNIPIIDALTAKLIAIAPKDANYYKSNAQRIKTALSDLDRELQGLLVNVKDKGFVVEHPAYDHFVQRYKLTQLDYIKLTPERRAGAKHLFNLRKARAVRCVFSDFGEFGQASAQQLSQTLKVPMVALDPLDANLDSHSLSDLIQQIGFEMNRCLLSRTP